MKMKPGDRKDYPKMAQYVRVAIPKLVTNTTIVYCLKKCGNMKHTQIIEALKWGTAPEIKIVDMTVTECAGGDAGPDLYGCNRNTREIEVARRVVEAFEVSAAKTLSSSPTANNLNTNGRAVYVLGASLLHELCHWGNRVNGVAEPEEMGLKFEKMAYGKTIW
jgi:hypothetical protein